MTLIKASNGVYVSRFKGAYLFTPVGAAATKTGAEPSQSRRKAAKT